MNIDEHSFDTPDVEREIDRIAKEIADEIDADILKQILENNI